MGKDSSNKEDSLNDKASAVLGGHFNVNHSRGSRNTVENNLINKSLKGSEGTGIESSQMIPIRPHKLENERRRFASVVEKTNGGDIAKIAELMKRYDPLRKNINEVLSEGVQTVITKSGEVEE